MPKVTISPREIKILWGKSAARCAICKSILVQDKSDGQSYPLGVMAHIEGENETSARYNPQMNVSQRSKYENLILVCPDHHTIIDNDIGVYTVEKLHKMKKDHEIYVSTTLKSCITDITFAELDQILKYLIGIPSEKASENLTIIPLKRKIEKNDLSPDIQKFILMGLAQVNQVKTFLAKNPDIHYRERLQSGFVDKYEELFNQDFRGDALFYSLWDFASTDASDFKIKAAGLSVLVYFFELCEVFTI